MPRLRQVPRAEASPEVLKYYDRLFGERDPVAEPGTATGTPGNWWTVFALRPYIFSHATAHFGMFGMFADKSISEMDPAIREIAITRAGFASGSRFVFSQHCKAARRNGVPEEKIEAIPHWTVSDVFSPLERAVLAFTDCVIYDRGRVPDQVFETLHALMSDGDILELAYHVCGYNTHALMCKALRLEFDDVKERITEVPMPDGSGVSDWAGSAWSAGAKPE
jgi:alkylhydroperoxidase family enzyme